MLLVQNHTIGAPKKKGIKKYLGIQTMLFALVLSLIWSPNTTQAQEWELVWSDEFEGDELDLTKWSYQTGRGANYGLVNWGNNELQFYTDRQENVFVQDGKLHIVAREEQMGTANYTSGRIRSFQKGDWTYGKFEIRAKLTEGQGLWPAIWMLPTESVYGVWPQSGEIDIMEALGHEPEKVYGSVHYGPQWPNNRYRTWGYTKDEGTFSEEFHVYSIIWSPGVIDFFVDGNLYFRVTQNMLAPFHWPFDQDFHLLLNVAVGGNWPGNPDDTTVFPQEMVVDYVRVYQDPTVTSVEQEVSQPEAIRLSQNFPNPFNPTTQIGFTLTETNHVNLEVYNVMGQRVATLVDETRSVGEHSVTFDASALPSGVYTYRLTSGNHVVSKRMTLIK